MQTPTPPGMTLLWTDDPAAPCRADLEALAGRVAPMFPAWQLLPAATVAEALSLLAREPGVRPDVRLVVVDLGASGAAGDIQRLRAAVPGATLIAVSADERRGTVMGAIAAGAAGFIVKTTGPEAILEALQIALDGGIPLPVAILERRTPDRPGYGTWRPTPRAPEAVGCSPDEGEVLRLLIHGHSAPRIAATLALPEAAVTALLAAVYRRLGSSARSQVVLEAARLGLRFGPLQALAAGSRASSIASP